MSVNLTTQTAGEPAKVAFQKAFSSLAKASADVARYCDHAEHNEPLDRGWVLEAAVALRRESLRIAQVLDADLIRLYAGRLREVEERNVLKSSNDFSGFEAVTRAKTLRSLQSVQSLHDRNFHPDVFGLSKAEQLRHYAFHLAKIVGSLAVACEDDETWNDFAHRRLPDMFLFGLKLATVMGETLPDEPLEDGEDSPIFGSDYRPS